MYIYSIYIWHTAYIYIYIYILYLVSSYVGRDQICLSEGTPDERTEYTAKRKLQIQPFYVLTASSKYENDFSPSEYVPDICCDSRWMNISRLQAVLV